MNTSLSHVTRNTFSITAYHVIPCVCVVCASGQGSKQHDKGEEGVHKKNGDEDSTSGKSTTDRCDQWPPSTLPPKLHPSGLAAALPLHHPFHP